MPSCAFTSVSSPTLTIPSKPAPSPQVKEVKVGVEKPECEPKGVQAHSVASIGVSMQVGSDDREVSVSDADLLQFLKAVVPELERELTTAPRTWSLFGAYVPRWEEIIEEVSQVATFRIDTDGDFEAGAVAWNSTGASVALAPTCPSVEGWADYNSQILVWHLFQADQERERAAHSQGAAGAAGAKPGLGVAPNARLLLAGHATCLSFHPCLPSLLAAGCYSGLIVLFDTSVSESDAQLAASSIGPLSHADIVTTVTWVPRKKTPPGSLQLYDLVTFGLGGTVLIWSIAPLLDEFGQLLEQPERPSPVKGLGKDKGKSRIRLPLSTPARGRSFLGAQRKIVVGQSVAISPFDSSVLVVGTSTGQILRGLWPEPEGRGGAPANWHPDASGLLASLSENVRMKLQMHVEQYRQHHGLMEVTAQTIIDSRPETVMVYPNDKVVELEPHSGPVVALSFSPHVKNLLLSAGGGDGAVKLFDVSQPRPLLTIYPPAASSSTCGLVDVAWSPVRPCVFAVAQEIGVVMVYDLHADKTSPSLLLGSAVDVQHPRCLRFNSAQFGRALLAVSSAGGVVKVLRLPHALISEDKDERSTLISLSPALRRKEAEKAKAG